MADDMSFAKGDDVLQSMMKRLNSQRVSFVAERPVSAEVRTDRINRAIGMLVDHSDRLCSAMSADFGYRSADESRLADIVVSIQQLKHSRTHLKAWMKPQRRRTDFPLNLLGARSQVRFEPKGVVGIVAPWNFPVNMVFGPLAGVLAAGNRAMIKPSEFTPRTADLLGELFQTSFDADEVDVFCGDADVGQVFTSLPFDHLLFTGSTRVGRMVMRAAAENLVPVTLELGGKSPTIVGRSASLQKAARRIINGKTLNAGQICLAPDYVLVAKEQCDALIGELKNAMEELYPSSGGDNDYSSMISGKHSDRMSGYLDDAKANGAKIIPLSASLSGAANKFIPTALTGVTPDMKVMKEEIFGPLLPIVTYSSIEEAIAFINARERPLALYYFGEDALERDQVLDRTISGGVTINDVIFHNAQEDLPFGGVGASGMGAYHGRDGFLEFSHQRAVFRQTGSEIIKLFRPPYGDTFRKQMAKRISR